MADLPSIPPLSSVKDDATRVVLDALVQGWEIRNGQRGATGDAFVSVADVEAGRALASAGTLSGVASGQPSMTDTRGSDGRLVDRRTNGGSGQARALSPAARLFAEVFSSGGSGDATARLTDIESPEWFRRRLAQHGTTTGGEDSSVKTSRIPADVSGRSAQDTTTQGAAAFPTLQYVANPRATVELQMATGQAAILIGEVAFIRIGEHRSLHYDQIEVVKSVNFAAQTVEKEMIWAYKGGEHNAGGVCDAALLMEDPDGAETRLRFHSLIAGHALVAHNQLFYRFEATKSGLHRFHLLATAERSGGYYSVAEDVGASVPPLLLALVI